MTIIDVKAWVLKNYPEPNGSININQDQEDSVFQLVDKQINTDDLQKGEVLVQTLYLSNDPAQKDWLNPTPHSYASKLSLGITIPSRALVKVIESKSDQYQAGDYINAQGGWSTYSILKDDDPLNVKVPVVPGISPHHFLGALGLTSLTAYFMLFQTLNLNPDTDKGKTILITGAAGAVGSFTVTLASKVFGAKKVIAIAGGPEKVKYVESLGPNIVGVDYKSSTFEKDLENVIGDDDLDYMIDSVGGKLLDLGINHIKRHGTIVLVGATSGYRDPNAHKLSNAPAIIFKSLTIKGFILFDEVEHLQEATVKLLQLVSENEIDLTKLELIEDAADEDFVKIPQIWYGLFTGSNKGKLLTKLSDI